MTDDQVGPWVDKANAIAKAFADATGLETKHRFTNLVEKRCWLWKLAAVGIMLIRS